MNNKRIKKIIGLLFLIIGSNLFAQNSANLKEEALKTQADRFTAMIKADATKVSSLLAEELTYAHTTGWIESKKDFITTIRSKKVNYLSISTKDTSIRIYEKTAIITGLADVKIIYEGKTLKFTIRYLEVSRKKGNMWKLVAWQAVKKIR